MGRQQTMVVLVITMIATHPCKAQDFETILSTHESSVASLHYLRCNFTNASSSTFFTRPRVLTGTITRGPSLLIVTAKATDFESLVYIRPGRVECLRAEMVESGGKRQRLSMSSVSPTLNTALDVDPYRDMLINFLQGLLPTDQNGLRQFLKNSAKKVEARKVGDEAHLLAYDGTQKIRLSTRHNYLVTRHEYHVTNDNITSDQVASVSEFFRGADGVVVPTVMSFRVTNTTGETTIILFDHTTKLTNIDTKPFDENAVKPRYPRDTKVLNRIDGTEYTVDEGGNVVGEVRPAQLLTVLAAASEQKLLPTAAEPARAGWWLLPAAVSVVAASAAAWLLACRRR